MIWKKKFDVLSEDPTRFPMKGLDQKRGGVFTQKFCFRLLGSEISYTFPPREDIPELMVHDNSVFSTCF